MISNIIINSGYNATYISSLFVALFYCFSYIEDIFLNLNPKDLKFMYLQEFIKTEIVSKFKTNKSILSSSFDKIRILSHFLGWKSKENLFIEHDVSDFFLFLSSNLTISDYCFFLNITINETTKIGHQLKKIFVKPQSNIYSFLIIHLLRNTPNIQVDIDAILSLSYKINDDDSNIDNNVVIVKWIFHSAIAFNGTNYYVLLFIDKKLVMFQENNYPCFTIIDLQNLDLIQKLQSEIILVFYKHNKLL